jgi:hypothetical protein
VSYADSKRFDAGLKNAMQDTIDSASIGLLFVPPGLYEMIGCAHMVEKYSQIEPDVFVPTDRSAVPSTSITKIEQALVEIVSIETRVLRIKGVVAASLLNAIVEYFCWGKCLETSDGSYGLARLILTRHLGAPSELASRYAPELLEMLNFWLTPEVAWTSMPSADVLCQEMFGHAWWQIRDPTGDSSLAPQNLLGNIVATERPAFREGLVLWRDVDDLALPQLLESYQDA